MSSAPAQLMHLQRPMNFQIYDQAKIDARTFVFLKSRPEHVAYREKWTKNIHIQVVNHIFIWTIFSLSVLL